jgi:hypothetical protein
MTGGRGEGEQEGGGLPPGLPGLRRQVTELYRQLLDRTPALSEQDSCANQVLEGKLTMPEVQVYILASGEYFDNAHNNKGIWVNSLFQRILGREAKLTEVRFWANELDSRYWGDRRKTAPAWLIHFGH